MYPIYYLSAWRFSSLLSYLCTSYIHTYIHGIRSETPFGYTKEYPNQPLLRSRKQVMKDKKPPDEDGDSSGEVLEKR